MKIEATLTNTPNAHTVVVNTNGAAKPISIPAKSQGLGSSVNGGELLFTALATCFCNDIYREAARRSITVNAIEVKVAGEFGNEGEAAKSISYTVKIDSPNPPAEVDKLIEHVDKIAEIHNTLRKGIAVTLTR
ncbi:MAG TPA: OsmC family protein [Chryseosolibacter sp.]